MINERIQWFAFQELNKTIPEVFSATPQKKALTAIGYFALIGGAASESNLLHILRYCGLKFENVQDMEAARDMFAFYSAAGIIEILDNNLGIARLINDSNLEFYQKGLHADTMEQVKHLSSMRNELLERARFGSGEDEAYWNSDLS